MDEPTTIMIKLKKVLNTIKVLKFVYILVSLVDLYVVTYKQHKKCDSKFGIIIPLVSRYALVNLLFVCGMCVTTLFFIIGIYMEQLISILFVPSLTLISLIGHFLNIAVIPCDSIRIFLIFHMLLGLNLALFIQLKGRLVRDLIVRRRRYN